MEMTIQEIATSTNTTKQNINQILKRAMRKVYWNAHKINTDWSPLDIIFALSCFFRVQHEKDFKKFFNDFPRDIRDIVISSLSHENELYDSFKAINKK